MFWHDHIAKSIAQMYVRNRVFNLYLNGFDVGLVGLDQLPLLLQYRRIVINGGRPERVQFGADFIGGYGLGKLALGQ